MIQDGVVKSTCGICYMGCGILVHLEQGKVVKIEGDPHSPISKGTLCMKGAASLDYLYHPDRLVHPLKRIGERGEGKWQRISWDDALSEISEAFIKARDNYGAESVVLIEGAAKGFQDTYAVRFANVFGTPNVATHGSVCFQPRQVASVLTHGFLPVPDYEYPPALLVSWALNTAANRITDYELGVEALRKGTKLMVIDPRKAGFAGRADLWLQLRPGSDLALALGMMNVIVNEGLFDKAFVEKWTVGFNELKAHVQDYPPDKVEKITWVPAEKIREAARFYATNKPACIELGNAVDQNLNSFQTARAISILRAITGNLGIPGGEAQCLSRATLGFRSPEYELRERLSKDKRQLRLTSSLKLLPILGHINPQSVVKAILEGDPYPVRVAYVHASNPLLTYSNAQEVYKAFKKLDFLAVADMFMTPTAALADIVLPAASYLEFNNVVESPALPHTSVQQKVTQIGECRSDLEIINGLAKKLGLDESISMPIEGWLNTVLKPAGVTFEEFRKIGVIPGIKQYRKYEVDGFNTPSRKVEIYSSRLKEWGFDPLPTYYELPETPYSDPKLVKEYPLIFTSCKSAPYRHSGGRQISTLRGTHHEPVVNIHPETAKKLGIKDGDWVFIETKRGRIKQKAALTTELDSRVVGVDYGWWFPEKGSSGLYGWAESNVNILTDDKGPYSREMGSAHLRGMLCKIYKEGK